MAPAKRTRIIWDSYNSSGAELRRNRHCLTGVASPEEVDVIQHVVKLVHRDARVELGAVAHVRLVRLEATVRKTAEEFHHGDVRPPVADAAGGIDHGDALTRVVPIARG